MRSSREIRLFPRVAGVRRNFSFIGLGDNLNRYLLKNIKKYFTDPLSYLTLAKA